MMSSSMMSSSIADWAQKGRKGRPKTPKTDTYSIRRLEHYAAPGIGRRRALECEDTAL
jgi:hypothetical protein